MTAAALLVTAAGVSWLAWSMRAEHAHVRRSLLRPGCSDTPGRGISPKPRPGAPWLEAGFVGFMFLVGCAMEAGL